MRLSTNVPCFQGSFDSGKLNSASLVIKEPKLDYHLGTYLLYPEKKGEKEEEKKKEMRSV